jgi:hypothetical protein
VIVYTIACAAVVGGVWVAVIWLAGVLLAGRPAPRRVSGGPAAPRQDRPLTRADFTRAS